MRFAHWLYWKKRDIKRWWKMPNYYKPKKVRLNDAQKKEEKKRYLFATGQKGFGLLRRKSE
jgi:hypothetical protein